MNFKTERKAIYDTARFFTECGWIFREQPIVDMGIDALVETPMDENGQLKVFALQIKGGEANFLKKKKLLTFYFSERHYFYWNAISKNYPLFIILQDPLTEKIYWQHYISHNISKTRKNWKLDISFDNVLNEDSKEAILDILYEQYHYRILPTFNLNSALALSPENKNVLTVWYNLDSGINNKIFMYLKYKSEKASINLGYKPKRKDWDFNNSFLTWENAYYYSIKDFEKYIHTQFDTKNKNKESFKILIDEINSIVKGQIENIAEFRFDYNNKENNVPRYSDFLKAFELHSKLKKGQYEAQALDHTIYFKAKKETFEMSTEESLTEYLKSYLDNDSYDEIYTETNEYIWGEIYIDAGIEKSKFIPIMQNEWERYWERLYKRIKEEIGHTDHLDKNREESWRKFKSFIDLYDDAVNIIQLAYDFDDMVFYPMAVITMMSIFNPEVCYDEYCELEFYSGNEWESINLNEENWDSQVFFIRPYKI